MTLDQLQTWSHKVASLIACINDKNFPSEIAMFIKQMAAVDSSVVMFYHRDYRPRLFYEDLTHPWRENQIESYLSVSYMLDPFYLVYQEVKESIEPGLYRLHDLVPDGFYESEYYRTYYLHSRVCDEVAFFAPTHDGGTFCASIQRRQGNVPFSAEDMQQLRAVAPIVCAFLSEYWTLHSASLTGSEEFQVGAALHRGLETFGESILTVRECDVVRLLLGGHSTKSAADRLKISPGTVKIHREKIYAKLDISSQAELFHLFIESMSFVDEFSGDPLEYYLSTRARTNKS